ncbi:helix-turn-helix domain-containing protein [uncultured Lactobacillus sp.]|uniref:winged helix-turn-helix transcriptional regulator n=1 Tax=uncultured Lactobacillus sp. TaxID=153152 RepID=UPI002805142D|nr:helix-turn-helix domain-containing protein [uncultured Lactobacillus sp.]
MIRHIYNCSEGCPVESTLQIISGKWKSVIIYHLIKEKNCRFSELQRLIPNCSRRMLSLQLKELINDHIISKNIIPSVPLKTSYSLTPLGKTLMPLILEMERWGEQYNRDHIKQD